MESLTTSPSTLVTTAAISAVVLHQAVLRRYEVDEHLRLVFASSTIVFSLLLYYQGLSLSLLASASFLTSLTLNIVLYRAYFHPLHSFPGPFGAKLTKLWGVRKTMKTNLKWYQVIRSMQTEYGDYVRIGPRELVIFDPAAIQPVLGTGSKVAKGPFYSSIEESLHTTRNRTFHRQRRKIWDNGMKQSMSDFEPRIEEFTDKLVERIENAKGAPIAWNEYCDHYTYDVMSVLAFGKSMGFTEGKSSQFARTLLKDIKEGMDAFGLLMHVPWLMAIASSLAAYAGPMKKWNDWSRQQLEERKQVKDPKPDLMMHLLANTEKTKRGDTVLFADSRLIIGAGSDTTASALACTIVHLALRPHYQCLLREEIDSTWHSYSSQKPQPILDAIIYESMRLSPSILFNAQRETPAEGLTIQNSSGIGTYRATNAGDVKQGTSTSTSTSTSPTTSASTTMYIPPKTILAIALPAMALDPRNFVDPQAFIAERWTTRAEELTLNRGAFLPFLTGPYACLGRGMALMELRSVITKVVRRFDLVLEEGFDTKAFFGGIKDHFVAEVPRVEVRFLERERVEGEK